MGVLIEANIKFKKDNENEIRKFLLNQGGSRILVLVNENFISWDQNEQIDCDSSGKEQGEYLANVFSSMCKEELFDENDVIDMFENENIETCEVIYEEMRCEDLDLEYASKKFFQENKPKSGMKY